MHTADLTAPRDPIPTWNTAANLALDPFNKGWPRIDWNAVTTLLEPRAAQGPLQSNGMCLAELTVHSKLKPKASTEHTVDLPHVTS